MMSVFFKMMISYCLADKHCCKVSEYIGLDKGYQNFNDINEDCKGNGDRGKSHSGCFGHLGKNKDQAYKAENDDVACRHVGKQPDDKSKRLCEYAK